MVLTRRRLLTATAGLLLASALPAMASGMVKMTGRAFGTSWSVVLRDADDLDALSKRLADILRRIDRSMSPFRTDSEISRFNVGTAGLHDAGADFAAVTAESLRIAALTGGAFDPSVGPIVGRYGFGPIHGQRVGSFGDFAVDGSTISKADPLLTLDLCGIAKGFALDLLAEEIAASGHADFLVELGGEVMARGTDEAGAAWRIGISNPLGGLHSAIDARGLAVATSGDAVNAYEVGGRRFSHTIDPVTGEPVVNRLASVTVLAPSAMTADALATAMLVMGAEKGLAFADARALPVLFLLRESEGLRDVSSQAFASHRLN